MGPYPVACRPAGRDRRGVRLSEEISAKVFIQRLEALQTPEQLKNIQRYFKTGKGEYAEGDVFIGVRMAHVFALAKEFIDLPPAEIEILLDHPVHEVRAGAASTMAKQAARATTPVSRRTELYKLYLRRHDRINNWDLVDLAARDVVGAHLYDKSRNPLYRLARSRVLWERRTSIVATMYFIGKGDLTDTFRIAEMLLNDEEDLIHKATGWLLRSAGMGHPQELMAFLDEHAPAMPRTLLRYSIERLDKEHRVRYMAIKKTR